MKNILIPLFYSTITIVLIFANHPLLATFFFIITITATYCLAYAAGISSCYQSLYVPQPQQPLQFDKEYHSIETTYTHQFHPTIQ